MELPVLPNEVLLLIFDRMNFRTRLTASLVCRQWNRLIFTSRFLQQLQLSLEIRQSQCIADAIACLQSSTRPYVKLKIIYQGNTQQCLATLTELLRSAHGIQELELLFFFYCFREKLNIVMYEVLASCPALSSISVGIRGRLMSWTDRNAVPSKEAIPVVVDLDEPQQFPSLTSMIIKRNPDLLHPRFYETTQPFSSPTFYVPPEPQTVPNLRHLAMNCDTDAQHQLFARLANQLEDVSVVSFDPQEHYVSAFLELTLPLVKVLRLPKIRLENSEKMCRFLRALRRVRVLEMDQVLIDREAIDVIFDNCPDLVQLALHMESLPSGSLKDISRLEHLEQLTLIGKTQNGWEPHEDYFQGASGQHERLRSVSIRYFCFTSSEFVSSMAQALINLSELRLEDCRAKTNIIGPIASQLLQLTSLEYNKVTHAGTRPLWPPKLTSVRLVNIAWANGDFLNKLVEQCPGLRRLSLSACGASRDAIQRITQIMLPRGCFVERTVNLCHRRHKFF